MPSRTRRLHLAARLLAFASLWAASTTAQPLPLPRAHAHNDYEHQRPLLDALDHGFGSVEADIHLIDGELLVAHDRDEAEPGRTLQALYLEPLRQRIRRNGGRVYPDAPPLLLLIDIKTEAEATYAALHDVLGRYADILTIFSDGTLEEGSVTAIVSGNRPRETMAAQTLRYAAYDGRLGDLELHSPATFIPLVSDNWLTFARWLGQGKPPEEVLERLEETVAIAHAQGRKIRFWATSDNPAVWRVLYDAGVDLLNADDLDGLRDFLLEKNRQQQFRPIDRCFRSTGRARVRE
jgi:hypothetical protein